MPYAKKPRLACRVREGRVTLHQPFFEPSWFARGESRFPPSLASICEGAASLSVCYAPSQEALLPMMLIVKASAPVRQPKQARSKRHAQSIR